MHYTVISFQLLCCHCCNLRTCAIAAQVVFMSVVVESYKNLVPTMYLYLDRALGLCRAFCAMFRAVSLHTSHDKKVIVTISTACYMCA
jgi:hypothetical protein